MTNVDFHTWSSEHFGALGVIVLTAAVMIAAARLGKRRLARAMEIALAALLTAVWPLSYWMHWKAGTLTPDNSYPCHFCDVAAMAGVLALITHRRFFVELVYFWGLAGTLQGLITPALTLNWPHPRFALFFIAHGGVVVAALYCVTGLRLAPRATAKWVALMLLVPFAAVVGTFDWLAGANYGFLRHKPETASLYDVLGEWPWYIGSSVLLGLAFFLVLDLPFMLQRRRRASG